MLSKVSNTPISVNISKTTNLVTNKTVSLSNASAYVKCGDYSITSKGKYYLKCQVLNGYSVYAYIKTLDGSSNIATSSAGSNMTTNTVDLSNYDAISYGVQGTGSDTNSRRVTLDLVQTSMYVSKNEGKKDKIFELKPIGKKATAILFGKLPDGTRRDGN